MGDYEDICYVIINASDVKGLDYEQLLDTSAETVKYSTNGEKAIVNWFGKEVPKTIEALSDVEGPYSHEEILIIANGPEWMSPPDPAPKPK